MQHFCRLNCIESENENKKRQEREITMGYQTRALPGSGTWMMESGIRNRITEWYLFVEKKKIQILQKFSMFRKEADLGKTVKIVGKQKLALRAE